MKGRAKAKNVGTQNTGTVSGTILNVHGVALIGYPGGRVFRVERIRGSLAAASAGYVGNPGVGGTGIKNKFERFGRCTNLHINQILQVISKVHEKEKKIGVGYYGFLSRFLQALPRKKISIFTLHSKLN